MMSKKQGKLKDNSGIVDSSDYIPKLAMPGTSDIVEVKEETWGSIFVGWGKGLFAFVLVATLFIGFLYSGLAATLMYYMPVDSDSSSRSWVVRGTWSETGGKPPLEEKVVISTDTYVPTEWWNNVLIGWTGVTKPAIVSIQSTPYDTLYIANGKVTNVSNPDIKGDFSSSPSFPYDIETDSAEQNHKLNNEYLVKCVSGSCTEGSLYIISKDQIFGEAK